MQQNNLFFGSTKERLKKGSPEDQRVRGRNRENKWLIHWPAGTVGLGLPHVRALHPGNAHEWVTKLFVNANTESHPDFGPTTELDSYLKNTV